MNSKNILRLLAILLVAVNVILLLMVASVYKQKYYVDKSYIENTYKIFSEEGITITEGAIPNEKLSGHIFSASIDEDYYETVAENLTGETISTRFMIPGGYALTTESGKSLEFSEDYYFKYLAVEDINVSLSSDTEDASRREINKARDAVEKFLSADDEGHYPADFTVTDIVFDRKDGNYHMTISETVNECDIFSHSLKIVLAKNGTVIYAEGKWCFYYDSVRYSSQIYDQVNILFIDKANRTAEDKTKITKVSPKYIIYKNDDTSSVLLVPAWYIEYSDGKHKIYDAENGNLINSAE